jgi:hypothetical protein
MILHFIDKETEEEKEEENIFLQVINFAMRV